MGDYIQEKYLKINELINKSKNYVYQEKHQEWVKVIVYSVLNNTLVVEIAINSMELLAIEKKRKM